MATFPVYRGLIKAGIEIFWHVHAQKIAAVLGLPIPEPRPTVILETYPRWVIKRLWPELRIPSKRKTPWVYVEAVYSRLQKAGYVCPSVLRPTVDQVDAMLCAVAAEACISSDGLPSGTVGQQPFVDEDNQVIREGYIVSP